MKRKGSRVFVNEVGLTGKKVLFRAIEIKPGVTKDMIGHIYEGRTLQVDFAMRRVHIRYPYLSGYRTAWMDLDAIVAVHDPRRLKKIQIGRYSDFWIDYRSPEQIREDDENPNL